MTVIALSDTLTGALIAGAFTTLGALITLAVTLLQNRHARAERLAAEATARRARIANVLGRVRTFLTDIQPERIGFNVDPETTPALMAELGTRLNVLRDELSILGAQDEDDRVTITAGDLEVALFNTFNRVSWHAGDLLRHRDDPLQSLQAALHWHARANLLARMVFDLVRGHDVREREETLRRLEGEESSL